MICQSYKIMCLCHAFIYSWFGFPKVVIQTWNPTTQKNKKQKTSSSLIDAATVSHVVLPSLAWFFQVQEPKCMCFKQLFQAQQENTYRSCYRWDQFSSLPCSAPNRFFLSSNNTTTSILCQFTKPKYNYINAFGLGAKLFNLKWIRSSCFWTKTNEVDLLCLIRVDSPDTLAYHYELYIFFFKQLIWLIHFEESAFTMIFTASNATPTTPSSKILKCHSPDSLIYHTPRKKNTQYQNQIVATQLGEKQVTSPVPSFIIYIHI